MTDDRASRSVFVGNIPYEATEEALRDIFCQVGSVASFRLVYDRETGKPKGYGFCEYQDVETAQSAMRNLNNVDFSGRQLRVGIAAGEQKDEAKFVQQTATGPFVESPYGEPVESEKAPEAISRAVASLPPEQMFELMKQMKLCIQNNPNEARNMLLQNPQLAYALLQAQIVMKIVDPQVALAMLHRQVEQIPPVQPTTTPSSSSTPTPGTSTQSGQPASGQLDSRLGLGAYASPVGDGSMANPTGGPSGSMGGPAGPMGGPMQQGPGREGMMAPKLEFGGPGGPLGAVVPPRPRGGLLGDMPFGPGGPQGGMGPRGPASSLPDLLGPMRPDMGLRGDFPGAVGAGPGPRGPVGPVRIAPVPRENVEPNLVSSGQMGDPRLGGMMDSRSGMGPRPDGGQDPRSRGMMPNTGPMGGPRADMGGAPLRPETRDPRQGTVRPPVSSVMSSTAASRSNMSPSQSNSGATAGASKQDQEKAQLIMQVLQLSDEQISMLPPDQRQSILILKEQIARSAQS